MLQKINSDVIKLYGGLKIIDNKNYHTNMNLGEDVFILKNMS